MSNYIHLLKLGGVSLLFHNLTLEDGLMQINAYEIMQDRYGYIWIASQAGLQRYDGYEFQTYYSEPGDSTSLLGGFVYTIAEDKNADLWIGTQLGLAFFDRTENKFRHYVHQENDSLSISPGSVRGITADHEQNTLWLAIPGFGVNKFDINQQTFTHFPYQPHGDENPNNVFVLSTYKDVNGQIWATTNFGLTKVNTQKKTLEQVNHPDLPNIIVDLKPHSGDSTKLWVSGSNSTLAQYDIKSDSVLHSLNVDQNSTAFLGRIIPDPNYSKSIFWINSTDGLYRVNIDTESVHHYTKGPYESDEVIQSILTLRSVDHSGFIWGDYRHGISYFDPRGNPFHHYYHVPNDDQALQSNGIFAITGGTGHDLWVGYLDKHLITRIDTLNQSYQHFDVPGQVRSLTVTSDEKLWIGTNIGNSSHLQIRNGASAQVSRSFTSDNSVLKPGIIAKIKEDQAGTVWICTANGLNYFSRKENKLFSFETNLPEAKILESTYIRDVEFTDDGTYWFATIDGLVEYNPSTNFARHYTESSSQPVKLTSNFLTQVVFTNGVVWIGTGQSGLMKLNPQTGEIKSYTVRNGLPDNTIYSILTDDSGNLWMATNNGLVRFNTDTEEIKVFRQNEGQLNQEFNINASYKDKNGRLFFGGQGGEQAKIVYFHPDDVSGHENLNPPKMVFNRIEAQNAKTGEIQLYSAEDPVILEPEQKHLTIHYAGIHYKNPQLNRYRYILHGIDENWVDAETERSVRLTNLSPGTYTFRLLTANSDGIWAENPLELPIRVLPPWWRTLWAYILYGLIFIGGVFAVDRFQRKRLLEKERQKAHEKELEHAKEIEKAYHKLEKAHENLKAAQGQLIQQEKLASLGQLTAGIAHEIKNPLNFVNNFSELSMELIEEAREEIKEINSKFKIQNLELSELLDDIETNLRKIHEHGSRADSIVKSMLQHSRGGSGKMEPTDLNGLVKEYVNLSFHGMRASKNPINVDIEMELDENISEVPLIAEDFSRVVVNLCNNAFDAMREKLNSKDQASNSKGFKPKLTVRTKSENEKVLVEIEDNGPGIPEKMKDKILQPFFTTKKGTEGTGLGLSITNDIVKAHGGTIVIETEPGKFTLFAITLNQKTE